MCTKRPAAGEQSFPIRSWLLYCDIQAAIGTRMWVRMRATRRMRTTRRMRMRMRMRKEEKEEEEKRGGEEEEQTGLKSYDLHTDVEEKQTYKFCFSYCSTLVEGLCCF